MEIQNHDGDLPDMGEEIEFVLAVIDDETFQSIAEHDVKVEF